MNRSAWPLLLVLALTAASARAADPNSGSAPSAEDQARFALLKKRFLQQQGIPAAAAVTAVVPPPSTTILPPGKVPPPPPSSWADQERQRSVEFNKQFGTGSYEGIVGFSRRCLSADGCDKLATADVIEGAYKFVGLEKDVDSKLLTRDSGDYKTRDEGIKTGLRGAMNAFHALPGANPSYEQELIKVSDPILKKIFTPAELIQYAQRNASSSDSPSYYTYLGQKLNATGAHAKAREAFDAALDRNPKCEEALSGRAEAKYELGDFPGAVGDAHAALELNPGDQRALTALKFSEGRAAGGSAGALPGAANGAAGFGDGADGGSSGSRDGAGAGEFAHSGEAVSLDAMRRSEALVADAKRSMGMHDYRSAAEALRKSVEINPSNAQAFSLASMAYSHLKNYEAAFSAAESGLKLAPRNGTLLDSRSFALNHLKDYRGALASADLALSINPDDAMAHFNRAAALGGLHDREGMLASLKTAAELDPKFAPIYESILKLPDASDIMYLFPGEAPTEAPAAKAAPEAETPRPWGLIGTGALSAALLLALFLALRGRGEERSSSPPPPLGATRRARGPAPAPSLLGGKYELGKELGAGGMGVVYEGKDRSLGRAVAIKRMREEIRWDKRERERFVSEAKLVAKLKHPNIVEIHAIVEQDGEVYLVFEYVTGRTLHDLLAAEKKLSFAKARQLFRGIVAALDYAQGIGVIHRDLKPANIMVDGEGKVRVMDFGIARLTQDALSRHSRTKTGTGSVVGTPPYMAPEQELSKARKESDVYSLAVCLYEALTGARPFGGVGAGLLMNKLNLSYEAPSKTGAAVPAGIDEVFAKAFAPEPDARYSSAGALLRALESLEAPSPTV